MGEHSNVQETLCTDRSLRTRFPDPASLAPAAATLTGLAVLDGRGQLPMRPMYFEAGRNRQ